MKSNAVVMIFATERNLCEKDFPQCMSRCGNEARAASKGCVIFTRARGVRVQHACPGGYFLATYNTSASSHGFTGRAVARQEDSTTYGLFYRVYLERKSMTTIGTDWDFQSFYFKSFPFLNVYFDMFIATTRYDVYFCSGQLSVREKARTVRAS